MRKTNLLVEIVAFLSGFIPILLSSAMGKDGLLAPDTAKLLFPTLIQISTTLIGFWAIALVFQLKTLHERERDSLKDARSTIDKMEKLTLDKDNLSDYEKKMVDSWSRDAKTDHKIAVNTRNSLRYLTGYGILVMGAFLLSILISVFSLGIIEEAGIGTTWVGFSLVPLLWGVEFSFLGMFFTVPEVPKELRNQMLV